MKRFFLLVLASVMLILLAGCTEAVDPYAVTLAAADDDYVETVPTVPMEVVFTRQTVYEGEDYHIIIRSLKMDAHEGCVLSMDIANNTEKKEDTKTVYTYGTDDDGEKYITGEETVTTYTGASYQFDVNSATVNGKEIDVSFSVSLSADDRTFDQIVLPKEALEGLGQITEICLFFEISDAEKADQQTSKISTVIYPYGMIDMES